MFSSIALIVAGSSLAIAGGVNKSIPTPPGSRTVHKGPSPLATDASVTGTAAVYGINNDENTNAGLGCKAYVRC